MPSINDYLYQGGISHGKGHKGAGSAGPDAHNEMIQQHLETWHRNRSHDQLNQFKVYLIKNQDVIKAKVLDACLVML